MTQTLEGAGALEAFVNQPATEQQWKPEFDALLTDIAESCEIHHSWRCVKELIRYKINQNVKGESAEITDKGESVQDYVTRIHQCLDTFDEPPFTLQRLCELIVRPTECGHPTIWKYLRALEKVLLVTSVDNAEHIHVRKGVAPMEITGDESTGGTDTLKIPNDSDTGVSAMKPKINGERADAEVTPMDTDD